MRRAVVAAVVALSVAAGGDAATGWRVVAANQTYALYAKLGVSANVPRPTAIALRVISHPAQRTTVNWSIVCTKEGRTGSTSGSYTPPSTALQSLRLPFRSPRSCKVSAHGEFPDGGGTLGMKIYARS